MAKLTNEQAAEIRARYRYGLGMILANEYGVAQSTIMRVARGRSYMFTPPTVEELTVRRQRRIAGRMARAA